MTPQETLKIIIVDDSQSVLIKLCSLVSMNVNGVEPMPFSSAKEALEHCHDDNVGLAIVDYMMPEMDGLQFIAALRAQETPFELPIMMLTTSSDLETRYKALQLGATDFLNKPFDELEFVTRARNLLSLSRSSRALVERASHVDNEVRAATEAIAKRNHEVILLLSWAAKRRDPKALIRINRTAEFARLIATALGMDREFIDMIWSAAPMCDFFEMESGAALGYEMLLQGKSAFLLMAGQIAQSYNKPYDAVPDAPIAARITAVADFCSRLISVDGFVPSFTLERAREKVEAESGSRLDPKCVSALLSRWGEVTDIAVATLSADEILNPPTP